jgi:hypothetical protein
MGWTFRGIAISTIAVAACIRLSSSTSHKEVEVVPTTTYTVPASASTQATPPNHTTTVCTTVAECQIALVIKGYDPGPIDGIYGQRTANAWAKCYKDGVCTSAVLDVPQHVPTYATYVPPVNDIHLEPHPPGMYGLGDIGVSNTPTPISDAIFNAYGGGTFIPYHGNGLGPTLLNDGTWSHSAGRGTGSHHGGIAH